MRSSRHSLRLLVASLAAAALSALTVATAAAVTGGAPFPLLR